LRFDFLAIDGAPGCKDRNLDRVVIPLSDGTATVDASFGLLNKVPYLIFDLAQGDIRTVTKKMDDFDLAWVLRSMHESSVGLQQLHSIGIAHQDIKPSNVLVFKEKGIKLSDLGRASHSKIISEMDAFPIPGDIGYAAPEQFYDFHIADDFSYRYITDLFHLGSLLFFFFLNCSATHAISLKLSESHSTEFTNTNFLQDLPYIQHAFSQVLLDLEKAITLFAGDLTQPIVEIIKQLCEPDPRRRGNPKVFSSAYIPQYDLQVFISRFDLLAHKAELRIQ